MKDIPDEWVQMAMIAYWDAPGNTKRGVTAALAAVAPLIAAAEREACAQILDTMVCDLNKGKLMPAPTTYPDTVRGAFAAAIRARSDAP